MAEYVVVNGARIERDYFEDNLAEAQACEWTAREVPAGLDHGHCLVCSVALGTGEAANCCGNSWLCSYCYDHVLGDTGNRGGERR